MGDIRAVVPDFQRANTWNSPGSTVVNNTPSKAGIMGSIPDQAKSHMPQGQKSKTLKKEEEEEEAILLTNTK